MLKLSEQNTDYTYYDIMKELGLNLGRTTLISDFMKREMKIISQISEDDLISWLKPYAKILIKHSNSASELLSMLNWDSDLTSRIANTRIKRLFGVKFKQAKKTFTDGFLGL
jgi:hypothetical protein